MMIQRSSRTTSLFGSSLNSSQLSVYSHASSVRSGGAELARVSSGGQASKTVSGHGYLTSSRTISRPKSQKSAISRARERRKQERRRVHTVAADEESLDGGDTSAKNDDLESYLMSFGGEKAGRLHTVGTKATAKRKSGVQSTSVLPRGSELDWDKLLESGDLELMSDCEVQSDDDSVFSDNIEDSGGGLDGSAFLKRMPARVQDSPGPLDGEQTKGDKVRRISNVSSVKFLGENSSSPTVSDLVLTDSLDSLSSTTRTQTPMATGQPRQVHTTARNRLSDSDQSLERNAFNDVKETTDLILTNEIDADAASSQDRAKAVTVRTSRATPSDSHATISEEQSISESFDFKPNMHVLSSIDQLEVDINQLQHHQSEESSFEQNLCDVHSLRELEEYWEDPPQPPRSSDKNMTRLSTSHPKGENNLTSKSSVSTKQAQFPAQPIPRVSSFKFSAASTTVEDIQHNVNYSSDEFESESVSEVESVVTETNDSIREDSAIGSGVGELTETVASGVSDNADDDDDNDRRGERYGDVDTGHSELMLSYSSFSEAEQIDKSGRLG